MAFLFPLSRSTGSMGLNPRISDFAFILGWYFKRTWLTRIFHTYFGNWIFFRPYFFKISDLDQELYLLAPIHSV